MPFRSFIVFSMLLIALFLGSCKKQQTPSHHYSTADSLRIINEIMAHRAEVDSFFRFDPNSPFNADTSAKYDGIHWFSPDIRFHFQSKLFHYENPETVVVYGTKGEPRKQLKYGYFVFDFEGEEIRLNVYKFTAYDRRRYEMYRNKLAVWFTDESTGKETYEVGRYVDVDDEQPDANYVYTIDFNNAYNPYCAYSATYSCAIPRKEDRLPLAVNAGEMKYHK